MKFRTSLAAVALMAGAMGCSDPSGPTPLSVAGAYYAGLGASGQGGALVFTTVENGEEINWLDRGARVDMVLRPDGTTDGRLFIPDIDADTGEPSPGMNLDQGLEGTWSMSNGVVEFDHEADTFVRDMAFVVSGDKLVGVETFGGMTFHLTLVRAQASLRANGR